MTNEELKGKIVEIVKPVLNRERISCNEDKACEECWFPCAVERVSRAVADALIAAGIGDVKAAEHRAEVTERALKLPCKVGDTVYQTDGIRAYSSIVKNIVFDTVGLAFDKTAIGKSVFLTREAAEARLKELEEKGK